MKYLIKSKKTTAGASKRFWTLWFPLTIVGALAVYSAFYLIEKVVAERLDAGVDASSRLVQAQLSRSLEMARVDLEFITRSQLVTEYLEDPSDERQAYLDSFFFTMATTYARYDQIRLLSREGQELARVNFNAGEPAVVTGFDLQDKSGRYYFKETVSKSAGQIYISRLDLNMEQGIIELPFKPVIRLAKAIYDENNNLLGVVVLNFLAGELLDDFRGIVKNLPGEKMLLNHQGYWLSSDVRAREWGFMQDSNSRFSDQYAEIWQQINQAQSGVIESRQGRFNFYTISPSALLKNSGLGDWKFVVLNTDHKIGMPFLSEHMAYLYPLMLAYLFSSGLLWLWARADSGREVAEKELLALNRLLEKRVEKRTAELDATKDAAILSLATLAETRDNETGQHIFRTQHYVKVLAEELLNHPDFEDELDEQLIHRIYKSAPLHDIGKVGIPDHILLKEGHLDKTEQHIMQAHTTLGSDAIEEAINSLSNRLSLKGSGTFLHCARDIAHYHHERWDGKGYPKGLAGEAIPLPARLMAVADVYDALVTERVYKKPYSKSETEHIILHMSEGQFDPRLLSAFDRVKDRFWDIKNQFAD